MNNFNITCKLCNSEKMILGQLQISENEELVWCWYCYECNNYIIYTQEDYNKIWRN